MTREAGATPPPRPARKLALAWTATAAVLMLMSLYQPDGAAGGPLNIFFWVQDFPVLTVLTALFLVMTCAPPVEAGRLAQRVVERPFASTLLLAATVLAVAWWGRSGIFGDFAYSRDEDLALYQAKLISQGRLFVGVPEVWRGAAPALQPLFVLILPGDAAWISSYLPVNSALHAGGMLVGAEPLVSPLLAAVGVVATFAVGRRLWPDRPGLAVLAAALLATSAQLVVTAMTAYAMTAHLALNMVWLWLFLRGGRVDHLAAIGVGVLAVGLHQFIFHPLFVGPFILQLWLDRRWRLAAVYTAAYAAICLAWILYWNWVTALAAGGAGSQAVEAGGAHWVLRNIVELLSLANLEAAPMIAKQLVRFITWQNPLTIALLVLGLAPACRAGAHLRALAFGLVSTIVGMAILLPDQTHGWGYRYLHGFLGSACLLAAFAWGRLAPRTPARAAAILFTSFAASVALVAVRAAQAQEYVRPYREAYAQIEMTPADVVIVQGEQIQHGAALVRNDPWLRNRPLTLYRRDLPDAQVRRICGRHSTGVFQASDAARHGIVTLREPAAARASREADVAARLRAMGCRVVALGG